MVFSSKHTDACEKKCEIEKKLNEYLSIGSSSNIDVKAGISSHSHVYVGTK